MELNELSILIEIQNIQEKEKVSWFLIAINDQ